jgi:hypothetical protein
MDIHMFKEIVQSQFGLEVRFISPTDLRLLSDPQSLGGHKLYCVIHGNGQGSSSVAFENGEFMEEVHQIGLELHQRELHAMKPDMLRQVALRCFNDMRTVFLVHDKRMLGIVKQELDHLVARHVLTLSQAETLDKSIADTFLPGSLRLAKLLKISKSSPEIRGEFLLKPVRGGKGEGIKFGDEYEPSEWISTLERLQSSELIPGQTCVVQRRIIPCLYDVVLKSSGKRAQYPLVGTYHAIHGKLLGFGVWRCSPDPICAISTGGSWTCTVQSNVQ